VFTVKRRRRKLHGNGKCIRKAGQAIRIIAFTGSGTMQQSSLLFVDRRMIHVRNVISTKR
jgi:hypothetical protein